MGVNISASVYDVDLKNIFELIEVVKQNNGEVVGVTSIVDRSTQEALEGLRKCNNVEFMSIYLMNFSKSLVPKMTNLTDFLEIATRFA